MKTDFTHSVQMSIICIILKLLEMSSKLSFCLLKYWMLKCSDTKINPLSENLPWTFGTSSQTKGTIVSVVKWKSNVKSENSVFTGPVIFT